MPEIKNSAPAFRRVANADLGQTGGTGVAVLRRCLVALASALALSLFKTTELRKQIEQSHAERAALEQREDSLQMRLAHPVARHNSLAQELERERVESSRRARELVSLQRPTAKPVQFGLESLALAPGRSRAEESTATVTLSPRTRQVRLSLTIGDSLFDRYIAELQIAEFETVRTLADLKPGTTDGRAIVITIPARSLSRSDYMVTLSGVAGNGDR